MSAFQYVAVDASGKREKGIIEADSARHVREKLRARALFPEAVTSVAASGKAASTKSRWGLGRLSKRIKPRELSLILRQMATLLGAGIPIDEMLSSVAEQSEKPKLKSILLGVRSRVLEGHSLAEAMGGYPHAFPELHRVSVAAGERSSRLHELLERLADYTERQHTMRQKILQALLYPSIMTSVALLVVVFLLVNVVPKIVQSFVQTHMSLPLTTRLLLRTSDFLQVYGIWLLGGAVLAVLFFRLLLQRRSARIAFDAFRLRLPFVGRLWRTINAARFSRTLSILVAAQVPILESLKAATQLVAPLPMRVALDAVVERVREGVSLHQSLKRTGYFQPLMLHLIASGEKSSQLDVMLAKAALQQEEEVGVWMQTALTLFEPMLLLLMGGIVLFIVLAVLLPIFSLDTMQL